MTQTRSATMRGLHRASPPARPPAHAGRGEPAKPERTWVSFAVVGVVYLVLGFALWVHAWTQGAATHTLCGCGDPALFLWFFQWPATALAHAENPFFSTALFHPHGINLLAQTSVTGLSIPLVPVTWIWGPVASLNVAATLTPAISAFTAFIVLRRWAPWIPAAFLGGLLYGFSPFVLVNLEFAHLMTAALMLLPLILAALDEILVRQCHRSWTAGLALGLLLFGQFFLSTELLVVTVVVIVLAVVALVAVALVTDRAAVRQRAPHAARGLAVGVGTGVVLLAWPVWFALDGPAHLSGLVWPDTTVVGGYVPSSFVSPGNGAGQVVYSLLGGYEGAVLPSGAYLGWGLLAVLAAGTVAFFRDRRLWFFAFVLVLCGVFSLGARRGEYQVAHLFAKLPLLENVVEQRFMAIGFLAAAAMLGIVLDRVWISLADLSGRAVAVGVTTVAAAVSLVPIGFAFLPKLPFTMREVVLPRWYDEVAPTLSSGQVLLSYPAPFSGIQTAMAWQAVNRIHYSQAGGGGPQGVAWRAGPAERGFKVLTGLGFGIATPPPAATPAQRAAVRQALTYWQVTMVVVATNPGAPVLQQGRDPTYAAAFMTAALGRLPTIEAGAWVWHDVASSLTRAPHESGWSVSPKAMDSCVARAKEASSHVVATLAAPECVARSSTARGS